MAYQYYYCPFMSPDQTTRDTMAKYAAKGASRCVICQPTVSWKDGVLVTAIGGNPALRSVPDDAVLLIDGHGSSMSSYGRMNTGWASYGKAPVIVPTTDRAANDSAALTAYRLAAILEKEGLPKSHIAVRMLTCYGAGPAAPTSSSNPIKLLKSALHRRDYDAGGRFAQSLAQSMFNWGWKSIVVGGYAGPTINSTSGGRTAVEIDDLDPDTMVSASSDKARYMAWFAGNGKKVGKPSGLRSQANNP